MEGGLADDSGRFEEAAVYPGGVVCVGAPRCRERARVLEGGVDLDVVFADGVADPDDAQARENQERVSDELFKCFRAAQHVIGGVGERAGDQHGRATDRIRIERVGDSERVIG